MQTYKFTIDVYSPDSIPMARLAEYMSELAKLLGESEWVHFSHLEPGSAVLVSNIEEPAVTKVNERLATVSVGDGPDDAQKAYGAIDRLLAKDNAVGMLTGPSEDNVVRFPGRDRPSPKKYGPFRERGSLDGILVRIGGIDDTVPVLLLDGEIKHHCNATVEMSKRLATHYRNGTLRVHGTGRWTRDEDGSWQLLRFDIEDFEVLDDAALGDVVKQLRGVESGHWGAGQEAISRLLNLRKDDEEAN